MGNQFLLPDELGWECNDKVSKLIDKWFNSFVELASKLGKDILDKNEVNMLWEVGKAELMDNMYAVIKKYQTKGVEHGKQASQRTN